MRRMLIVARQEYLLRVRTRAFLIGTLLVPVFMAGLFILPGLFMTMNVGKPTRLAVVDETGVLLDPLQAALRDTTKTGERLYTLVAEAGAGRGREELEKDLGARVAAGEYGGFFIIPGDVLEGGDVTFYAENVSDFRKMEGFDGAVDAAVREVRISRTNLSPEIVREVLQNVKFETFKVGKTGEARKDSGTTFGLAYAVGFIFYISLLGFGMMMLRAALEEKTSRSAELMVATVRPSALMGGKILGLGLVGLTQIAVWALLVWIIGNSASGMLGAGGGEILGQIGISSPLMVFFVIYFVLGFLFYSALFGAAGAMVNSDTEAQQVQTPIMLPIIFALMLMFIAIRDPGNTVARVASMIPFFSPIVMMVRITVLMPPLWEIGLSLLILLASIWGVMWAAGRIFRVGLLMYGKRPDLPELMKWIRYG